MNPTNRKEKEALKTERKEQWALRIPSAHDFFLSYKGVNSWLQSVMNEEFNERHLKLTLGAVLVEKMRLAVLEQTGFKCSAGIAANKMLAKLSCG